MKTPILSAVLLAVGCAAGPGYYTHNAELVGSRYHRAAINTYPLVVASVDGRSTPVNQRIYVEPGRRDIVVEDPMQPDRERATKHLLLDVQPCTRYYLVAVKDTRRSSDYQVKVDYAEPLAGGCSG